MCFLLLPPPYPRLESGSAYSFLVGDRVEEVSSYGESETFEIVAAAVSSDTAAEDDGDTEVAAAADTGDDDSFNWIIVIVAVAGACFLVCCWPWVFSLLQVFVSSTLKVRRRWVLSIDFLGSA